MTNNKKISITKKLILFLTLSIISLILLSFENTTPSKKNITPKAQTTPQTQPFFGFNIHSLPLLEAEEIKHTLSLISRCNNATIVRFWGFSAGGNNYNDRLTNAKANLSKVLANAPDNIRFIITLSNYYISGVFQPWPAPEDNPTTWYSEGWKNNGFSQFVQDVTKTHKDNPKIFMWEIMNEPNCTPDQECINAQHQFLKDVADIIARNDPNKLISAGNQGQNANGERFDKGDYEKIISQPNISIASCHTYIDSRYSDPNNCFKALEIAKKNNKPLFIGEIGAGTNCISRECKNTCSNEVLQTRKNKILTLANQFTQAEAAGVIVWQFSLERDSRLQCDEFSVFPDDPFCSNQAAPATRSVNTPQQTGQVSNTTINLNPQNPNVNNPFKIIISSPTAYVWVFIKIFDKDNKVAWEPPKDATQPKVTRSQPIQWVYDAPGLPAGNYQVKFYINCHTGCSETASKTFSIAAAQINPPPPTQPTSQPTPTTPKITVISTITPSPQITSNNLPNNSKNLILIKTDFPNDIDWSTARLCSQITNNNVACHETTIQTNKTNDGQITLVSNLSQIKGFCAKKINKNEIVCYVLF